MKTTVIGPLTIAATVWLVPATSSAAVFQYAVPVETTKGQRDAFCWIPPEAQRIRGVVLGGMTLAEREIAKDPVIRRACTEEQLAIVFLKCGLGSADIDRVLVDFATSSGYDELTYAPLFFMGHSAGGPQAKALAIEMAPRCFGLMLYRGGVPGGDQVVPPGIPVLMMIGQFDEFGRTMRDERGRETWEGGRDALAAFRSADKRNLASVVVEPGAGHFAWSERNAQYLAHFIRKAARARIPAHSYESVEKDASLLAIDHRQGWFTDLNGIKSSAESRCAAYADYSGDRSQAAWHFDREMAEATIAYHKDGFGKRDQFIRWEDPHWVDAGARFFFTKLTWVDLGSTLQVHPVFADVYPGQYKGRGPRWLEAGSPVGHCDTRIRVKPVGGPIIAMGSDRLTIRFDALSPASERARVTFMAYHEGNEEYRHTEHVGMMPRGFDGLRKGVEQTITFPLLPDLPADSDPVSLKACSDSGLPVEYYVAYGPAEVVEGKLTIRDVPARAKYPVPVKVVAWQFGSGVPPLVQTAEPIEQVVLIRRVDSVTATAVARVRPHGHRKGRKGE